MYKPSGNLRRDWSVCPATPEKANTQSEICSLCGGSLAFTGDYVEKDEFDVIIKTVKLRHTYAVYVCTDCGAQIRLQIEKHHINIGKFD